MGRRAGHTHCSFRATQPVFAPNYRGGPEVRAFDDSAGTRGPRFVREAVVEGDRQFKSPPLLESNANRTTRKRGKRRSFRLAFASPSPSDGGAGAGVNRSGMSLVFSQTGSIKDKLTATAILN